jgi:hypothetical protein
MSPAAIGNSVADPTILKEARHQKVHTVQFLYLSYEVLKTGKINPVSNVSCF